MFYLFVLIFNPGGEDHLAVLADTHHAIEEAAERKDHGSEVSESTRSRPCTR